MSVSLAQVRCFKHVEREAAAKCLECDRFYCRECVTEHEGRVVCRECLESLVAVVETTDRSWLRAVWAWCLSGVGYFLAVYVFYLLGRMLLKIPSNFHSGVFFE